MIRSIQKKINKVIPGKFNNSGQAGLEYIILTIFVLTLLIGIIAISGKEIAEKTSISQAEDFVSTLSNGADEVYSLGPGSKKYFNLRYPGRSNSVTIDGKEISLKYKSNLGFTDIYRSTKGNVTGIIENKSSQSFVRVLIEHQTNNVILVNNTK